MLTRFICSAAAEESLQTRPTRLGSPGLFSYCALKSSPLLLGAGLGLGAAAGHGGSDGDGDNDSDGAGDGDSDGDGDGDACAAPGQGL